MHCCRHADFAPSGPSGIARSRRNSHSRLERSMSIVASPRSSSLSLLPSLTPSQKTHIVSAVDPPTKLLKDSYCLRGLIEKGFNAKNPVQTIRKSWKHINTKGLYTVIRRCFQRLESARPSVSSAFNNANNQLSANMSNVRTLAEHTKFMLTLIDRIVDSEQDIVMELRRIGACHAILRENFGFGEEELERFGELLAESFLKLDGIRQSKETSRAWRLLIASMIDQLRVGFDSEWRMQKRRASFNSQASGGSPQPENSRRNSVPMRKSSLHADVAYVTRKLSNF